jgi:hypothetical protein
MSDTPTYVPLPNTKDADSSGAHWNLYFYPANETTKRKVSF